MNTLKIGKRIKEQRNILNLTQEELGTPLGLNKSTIQRYEAGRVERIKLPIIQELSKRLNVNPDWLACKTDTKTEYVAEQNNQNRTMHSPAIAEEFVTYPVIGDIAAGYDHIAEESWDGDYIDVPLSYLGGRKKEDFFVLRVKGDSMYPSYHNGDKVLILKQSTLDYSGQIGAILYDNDFASLKKVEYKMGEDWLRLIPINPSFPPIRIENEHLEGCRVLGIPKMLIREIKE